MGESGNRCVRRWGRSGDVELQERGVTAGQEGVTGFEITGQVIHGTDAKQT